MADKERDLIPSNTKELFPAKMNTKIKNKTYDSALDIFKTSHGQSSKEYLVEVDNNGYVHNYRSGGKDSVSPRIDDMRNKGKMYIHNHPKGGWDTFSRADLFTTASTSANGIVATSYRGMTFTFKKGTHFKEKKFKDALSKAKLRGLDYNHAVDNWLTANQTRYGYKYKADGYKNPSRSKGKK